jgi:hypothetical protein
MQRRLKHGMVAALMMAGCLTGCSSEGEPGPQTADDAGLDSGLADGGDAPSDGSLPEDDARVSTRPCGGPCPSGVCLSSNVCAECVSDAHCSGDKPHCDTGDNVCVECGSDADCGGDTPRCNTETQVCVACLPGPDDNCPLRQYCDTTDGYACKVGCNIHRCASGVCEPDGDCSLCVADDECDDGRVCSTRECVSACGGGTICPDGFDCCDTRCAALERDSQNCKACGTECESKQFCGGGGCTDNTLANVCDAIRISFLLDGLEVDNAMTEALQIGFADKCPTPQSPMQSIEQTSSDALNQMTGQPVIGNGELVVVLGGPFGQHIVRYLENNKLTKSWNKFDGATAWFFGRSSDDSPDPALVTAPYSVLSEDHDFFVIETLTDPISRSRALKVYGLDSAGTRAAAWFFANRVLTSPESFSGDHYIYEWTDADDVDGASEGDTFTLVTN